MNRNLGDLLDTSEIIRRYLAGTSSKTIAAALGCTKSTVLIRLRKAGIQPRGQGKVKPHGPAHHSWKGELIGYGSAHDRVRRLRGAPAYCEQCKSTDPNRTYDWANLNGQLHNPDDYARMCRSCHRKFDYARARERRGLSCRRGHDESEVILTGTPSYRQCRACRREDTQRYRAQRSQSLRIS